MNNIPYLKLVGLFLTICFNVKVVTSETYHSPDNLNCIPCPPGYKVDTHCAQDVTESKCSKCPKFYYSSVSNKKTYCNVCKPGSCPKHADEHQACTPTTNRECRCREGYHRHPPVDGIDPFWECHKHTECPEGQVVISPGTHMSDTVCGSCGQGEYVDTSGPGPGVCQTCTVCPMNSTEIMPCTPVQDRICGLASNATTESPSITGAPQTSEAPPEAALLGGEIAGIIIGVLLGLAIVVIIVVLCVVMYRRRRSKKKGEDAATTVGSPASQNRPRASSSNGHVGSGTTHSEHAQDSAGTPLLPRWTTKYISGTIFQELSEKLGKEWRDFIRFLPGWKSPQEVETKIEHAQDEERRVKDQIFKCLNNWMKECPNEVSKENIFQTLGKVGRSDLCDKFDKKDVVE